MKVGRDMSEIGVLVVKDNKETFFNTTSEKCNPDPFRKRKIDKEYLDEISWLMKHDNITRIALCDVQYILNKDESGNIEVDKL